MVVDNLYALGGLAQRQGFDGPVIGKKMATQNKRDFDDATMKAGQSVIGLQFLKISNKFIPFSYSRKTFTWS